MMAAMMNRSRSLCAVCLTAAMMVFTFSAKAEELTKFERLLDRVESNFWRALFAPETSETRKMFQRYTDELQQSAQYIKKLQQMNGNLRTYGDLTGGSSKLAQIIIPHSAFRKKRMYVSGIKRTDINTFRRTWRPQGDLGKRIKNMPQSEIPLEEYLAFLEDTIEKNLSSLSKKFNSNRELSYSQREMLRKTAEDFYTIIQNLRMAILRTRKYDPLFKAEKPGRVK